MGKICILLGFLFVSASNAAPLYRSVATGFNHTCAVLKSGDLKCWGSGDQGLTGLGTSLTFGDKANDMGDALPIVKLGKGAKVLHISAGTTFTCALLSSNEIKCWGRNDAGQLGIGDNFPRGMNPLHMGDYLPPVNLGTTKKIEQLVTGARHSCVLFEGGAIKCWGLNSAGHLGIGTNINRGLIPTDMGENLPEVNLGSEGVVNQIAAGFDHTCALFDSGKIKCWGFNSSGQLGLGNTTNLGLTPAQMGDALPFVDLGKGRKAKFIALGGTHSCAILVDGDVKCWGSNINGQLGYGDTVNRGQAGNSSGQFLPVVNLGSGFIPRALTLGVAHSCAISAKGEVKCWGANASGQLGLEDMVNWGTIPDHMGSQLPILNIEPSLFVSEISCHGANHCCARMKPAGNLKCWGQNNLGQLGLEDALPRGAAMGTMGYSLPFVDLGDSVLTD